MSLSDIPLIENLEPIVITPTRYGGVHEGYAFVSIPVCNGAPSVVLPGAFGEHVECREWWENEDNHRFFGKGDTPTDAFADMLRLWYPEESYGYDEDEDEESYSEDMREARYDAMALITSYADAIVSKDFGASSELNCEISEKWEDSGDISPIVMVLTALAYRLTHDLAEAVGVEPQSVIQTLAIDLEQRAIQEEG